MDKALLQQIEGYADIVSEREILQRYGYDYTLDKGLVKTYIERLHPRVIDVAVVDIIEETKTTKTLRLAPRKTTLPPFQAGQYVSVVVEIGKIRTSRPYSISSSPDVTSFYDITVRRVEGGLVSNYLIDSITIGDSLQISGPTGNFYYNPIIHGDRIVCIAGGSGITPFKSMIQYMIHAGSQKHIWLFYGSKTYDELIFHEYFSTASKKYSFFHYVPVCEDKTTHYSGYITSAIIQEVIGDSSHAMFFLCGPQGMYNHLLGELQKLNVKAKQIKMEMYGIPTDIFSYPGWPKEISKNTVFTIHVRGKSTFTVHAGESLLQSLEKNGIVVPSLCRSGECSMCRVKLIRGKVFQPQGVKLRQADMRFGYIHSCAAFPVSDCEIML